MKQNKCYHCEYYVDGACLHTGKKMYSSHEADGCEFVSRYDKYFADMYENFVKNKRVEIPYFGRLILKRMKPRIVYNPRTKEPIQIQGYERPIFRPCIGLKKIDKWYKP